MGDETKQGDEPDPPLWVHEVVRTREALRQLLHEVIKAGFETATDYNWPKAIADAKAALE